MSKSIIFTEKSQIVPLQPSCWHICSLGPCLMSLCKFHQISFWFTFMYQELSLVLWPSAPSFFCKEVYTTTEPDTSIQEWATEGTCQWIIDGINLASLVLLWEIILKYQSWTIIPALSQLGNIAVIKLGPILCTIMTQFDLSKFPNAATCKSWSMDEVFQTHIGLI